MVSVATQFGCDAMLSKSSVEIRVEAPAHWPAPIDRVLQEVRSGVELTKLIKALKLSNETLGEDAHAQAVKQLQDRISIQRAAGSIFVHFKAEDLAQSREGAAHVAARILRLLEDYTDGAFQKQIARLDEEITEARSKSETASAKASEFLTKHPKVAIPKSGVASALRREWADLSADRLQSAAELRTLEAQMSVATKERAKAAREFQESFHVIVDPPA